MSHTTSRLAALLFLLCSAPPASADVPTRGRGLSAEARKALDLIRRSYGRGRLAREIQSKKRRQAGARSQQQQSVNLRVPVLLGKYSGSENRFPRERFQSLLFDPAGYSMAEYYSEVSYGKFNLTGHAFDWEQVPREQSFYAANNGLSGGGARFVRDLVERADDAVDFSQFSYDEEGYAYAVAAVHTGGDAASGDAANIHSFMWNFDDASSSYPDVMPRGAYVTNDPWPGHPGEFIKVNEFTIQPELHYGPESELIEIGVFCHEFGHALGLPDLYDATPEGNPDSAGVGHWCLMGQGAYGGDGAHPETPVHMSAWSRQHLGWAVPTLVTSDLIGQTIPAVEGAGGGQAIFKIEVTSGCGEYFLVENRQKVGFDKSLPGAGLLIWHVDECIRDNNEDAHYKVALMQADGERDLEAARTGRADPGDPFPGSGGARNPNRTFDGLSNPSSKSYGGRDAGIAVSNISDPSDVMTADLHASRAAKVLGVSPARNGRHVPAASTIRVDFSREIDPGSLDADSFVVSGSVSGRHAGSFSVSGGAVTFAPAYPFESGEVVTAILSDKIKSVDLISIAPHVSQFTVASPPAAAKFKPGASLSGDYQYLRALFVADLSGDRVPDLVAAGRDRVSLWVGTLLRQPGECAPGSRCPEKAASRTFKERVDVPAAGEVYTAQAADMDGDGDFDLVLGGVGSVGVALNNGDGTFRPTASHPIIGGGFAVSGDFDGDGDVDVAAAGNNRLSVLRNVGDGTLRPPDYYDVPEFANAVVAADFDSDGDLDLAVSGSAAGLGRATIFTNCSDATFTLSAQHRLGNFTNTMLAADLEGDGGVDLLQIGCCGRNDGYSLRNNGDGTFSGPEWHGVWGNVGTAADFDGNGVVNIALIDTSYNPSFGRPPLLWLLFQRTFYELDHAPNAVTAADLDGDGDIDLAMLSPPAGTVRVLLNAGSPSRKRPWKPSPGR